MVVISIVHCYAGILIEVFTLTQGELCLCGSVCQRVYACETVCACVWHIKVLNGHCWFVCFCPFFLLSALVVVVGVLCISNERDEHKLIYVQGKELRGCGRERLLWREYIITAGI